MPKPRIPDSRETTLSRPSLMAQVLGVNAALIAATVLAATLLVQHQFAYADGQRGVLLLTAALLATVLVNGMVLRRRFEPLERLIRAMESVDLQRPGGRPVLPTGETHEVVRLHFAFERMLDRLQAARSQAASAVMRGQETELRQVLDL